MTIVLEITKKSAVMHMIGQSAYMWDTGVSIAQIAVWLKVSKPTARTFVNDAISLGVLVVEGKTSTAKNAKVLYTLSEVAFDLYLKKHYLDCYRLYMTDVQRVAQGRHYA